jgi:hypothetical protein
MPAPKGNEYWKLRDKHGRDRIFETPELMLSCAKEYFQWVDDNPLVRYEAIKSGDMCGKVMEVPISRPYTWDGLCQQLECNTEYFTDFEKSLVGKNDELSKDFSRIITHIRQTINRNKLEGASVGIFNANIVARELGMIDKKDVTSGGDKITWNEVRTYDKPESE